MDEARHRQLIEEGYCTFPGVAPQDLLDRLRTVCDRLWQARAEEARGFRAQGSMFALTHDPGFADLIAWPPALEALAALGYPRPTYTDGYVISKPPHSPRLFWHYDWFAWEDPTAYDSEPQQVFLMYYLSDTCRENGCLRVIPGSHRRHNALHDALAAPHSPELSAGGGADRPEFSTRPDEVDLPVRAGDLLVGDARLLHATHENRSEVYRTVITLWYQPDFDALPDRIQAQMAAKTQALPDDWPPEAREKVARLLPRYTGDAPPYGRSLYRRNPAAGREETVQPSTK